MPCIHAMDMPTGDIGHQLTRSLSPRRERNLNKERWPCNTNTSTDSNSSAAWRAFMEGSSVASEAGAVGVAGASGAARAAGAGSKMAGHDCSVDTAASLPPPPSPHPPPEHPLPPATPPSVKTLALRRTPSPVPRSQRRSHPLVPPQSLAPTPPAASLQLLLPSGSPVRNSYGHQLEPPPAAAPAASPRRVSLPPAAPTTPRMQPSSRSRHVRPPPEPARSRVRCADSPSEGSAARPAARPPFAWLLGARTPKPLPAWADPLVATGYAAALGLDEALADLCVRAYSSMLTTCDRPAAGCWDGWELYSFALVGTAAGLASALFYMPLVYRR